VGHAYVKNLSQLVIRQVYAKGKVSLREMTEFAIKKGEWVHASEGDYEEYGMISMMLSEIVNYYLHGHKYTPQSEATPVLEACDMDERQKKIYDEWVEDGEAFEQWRADEGDPDAEYNVFDSIKWRYAPGWRKRYPDLPLLEHYEN
jgi:hypothetical protein